MRPDGAFRFTGLRAGTYTLTVPDTSLAQNGIVVDGRSEAVVNLAAPGWAWEVSDGGSGPGFGVVRCRVKGRPDVALRLWTTGWEGTTQRTGSKAEYGPDACEFAPLGAGRYSIRAAGVGGRREPDRGCGPRRPPRRLGDIQRRRGGPAARGHGKYRWNRDQRRGAHRQIAAPPRHGAGRAGDHGERRRVSLR